MPHLISDAQARPSHRCVLQQPKSECTAAKTHVSPHLWPYHSVNGQRGVYCYRYIGRWRQRRRTKRDAALVLKWCILHTSTTTRWELVCTECWVQQLPRGVCGWLCVCTKTPWGQKRSWISRCITCGIPAPSICGSSLLIGPLSLLNPVSTTDASRHCKASRG